jgi:hypothetical protein
MTKQELDEATELLIKIRDNYIPPGPFLGGRVWRMTKEEAIEALIKWKNKQ